MRHGYWNCNQKLIVERSAWWTVWLRVSCYYSRMLAKNSLLGSSLELLEDSVSPSTFQENASLSIQVIVDRKIKMIHNLWTNFVQFPSVCTISSNFERFFQNLNLCIFLIWLPLLNTLALSNGNKVTNFYCHRRQFIDFPFNEFYSIEIYTSLENPESGDWFWTSKCSNFKIESQTTMLFSNQMFTNIRTHL